MLSLGDILLARTHPCIIGGFYCLGHRSVTVASMPFLTNRSGCVDSRKVCVIWEITIPGLENKPGVLKLYACLYGAMSTRPVESETSCAGTILRCLRRNCLLLYRLLKCENMC